MEIKYEACSDWAVLKIKVYAKHRAILFVQVSSRVVKRFSRNYNSFNRFFLSANCKRASRSFLQGKGYRMGPIHPGIVKFREVPLTALVFSEGGWVGVEL